MVSPGPSSRSKASGCVKGFDEWKSVNWRHASSVPAPSQARCAEKLQRSGPSAETRQRPATGAVKRSQRSAPDCHPWHAPTPECRVEVAVRR
ncbi:MAG: hypothetical protein JWM10_2486 [Myxococcaceae bacterium]|nr:hypothetical protein [Myxococcaceae bacterium]